MHESTSYYYLYCVNMGCSDSIFGRIKDIQLLLTIDNLISNHYCCSCHSALISSIEIEMEQMLSGAGIKSPDNSDYTSY